MTTKGSVEPRPMDVSRFRGFTGFTGFTGFRPALLVMTLFVLQPVVNFALANLRNHDLAAARLLPYFLISYGVAWGLLLVAVRFRNGRGHAATALFIGGLFGFTFNEYLLLASWSQWHAAWGIPFRALYLLYGVIGVALFLSSRLLARSVKSQLALAIFLGTLVLSDSARVAGLAWEMDTDRDAAVSDDPGATLASQFDRLERGGYPSPNVYFFLPDSHVGEIVSRELNLSAEVFDALREREFRVVSDAVANASVTTYSLAHLFHMSLVLEGEERLTHSFTDRLFRWSLSERSPVIRGFRDRRYDFVWFYDGYDGPPCPRHVDRCLQKASFLTKQDLAFVARTPALRILKVLRLPRFEPPLYLLKYPKRLEVWEMFDYLPDPDTGPFFLFAHLSLPHSPYRFDTDCRYASLPYGDEAFKAQFQCAALLLTELVDHVRARDPGAIIVLQSDTGEIFDNVDTTGPYVLGWPEASLPARFNILSAFYAPDSCQENLRSGISPVNTFRWVFACLDGQTPVFVPDRSWVTRYLSDRPDGTFLEWHGSLDES